MPARLRLAASVALVVAALLITTAHARDEGWVIDRFNMRFDIGADGTVTALDAIDVDFRGISKHGIYRDFDTRFVYDSTQMRIYDIDVQSVTSADGRRHQIKQTQEGSALRFRIGDPDHTISGRETYRIAYRIGHALNGFTDHDELYWNATGHWPVTIRQATVVVHAPGGAIERVGCFQGVRGSTEPCGSHFTANEATFNATRPLEEGEQLTIVTGLRKGAVTEPVPHLIPTPRDVTRMFDVTHGTMYGTAAGFALMFGGLGLLWWRVGRDRQYVSDHYLSNDTREQRVPLFGRKPIAVEFEPPDRIRPGQMGLLVDERADTLDVTATIIDLAVRGYLTITELEKTWFLGKKDWQVTRLKEPDAALLDYERIVMGGLFRGGSTVKLSDLKNHFYKDLNQAKTALYKDAAARKWFPSNPNSVRALWTIFGVLGIIAGIAMAIALGTRWGWGLLGLPIVIGGFLMILLSRAMPRRTALGRSVLHRTLGFARYIRTAETAPQDFAERANLFTTYLPYAIVFKCVDRWARAFKDLDLQAATAGWYVGSTNFNALSFSSTVSSFSSSVSHAIASTPGGSGSSGFSGGSSGGGGGGGGGGSW